MARKQMRCGLDELKQFDEIIDVRTPAEFADDHIPGAINAPVMSNAQRARIGTIYKQQSAFKAKRLGAAYVAQNISTHLETLFANRPKNWKPMVYCWRGGKRSGAMATWFNMIGWRAKQLEGGYKSWRRHVIEGLKKLAPQQKFIVLAGPTGSGKTRLLNALGAVGAQTLDLEALAHHRGSLLGGLPDKPQPSQRQFETRIYHKLASFKTDEPVFVEAESRRVGQRDVTGPVIDSMHQGRCIWIQVDLAKRIEFLLEDYAHLFARPELFKQQLSRLKALQGKKTIAHWHRLIDSNQRKTLFTELVEKHYDPAYFRSSHSNFTHLSKSLHFAYDPTDIDHKKQAINLLNSL